MRQLKNTCLAGLLAATAFLVAAVPAGATVTPVCTAGSAAGHCEAPGAVAIGTATNDIYVADGLNGQMRRPNHRIDAFEKAPLFGFDFAFGWGVNAAAPAEALQTCTSLTGCLSGTPGSGPGQMQNPYGIAVDRDPASPSYGDVYEGMDGFRIRKFSPDGATLLDEFGSQGTGECEFSTETDPIAVGPGGTVYVLENRAVGDGYETRLEKFTASGVCAGQEIFPSSFSKFGNHMTVDSTGDIYVSYSGILEKFDGALNPLCSANFSHEEGVLAVDGDGDLFTSATEQPVFLGPGAKAYKVISQYGSSCNLERRFGYGAVEYTAMGLAVQDPAVEGVYVSEQEVNSTVEGDRVINVSEPPPGPIISPISLRALAVGNSKATIQAEINPEGDETAYRVEYVTQKAFEEQGDSFTGSQTESTPAGTLPADFSLHGVSAAIGCANPVAEPGECLDPETTYRFRVVATNSDGAGEGTVEGPTFTTKEPFEINAVWSQFVGLEGATFGAEVNPQGIPASGYFEYVTGAQFSQSGFADATRVPTGEELQFGEGKSPVAETPLARQVAIDGLAPGTTYHYRLVVKDALASVAPRTSAEHTFTTFAPPSAEPPCPENEAFRTGPSAALPDCRAYEMVSPIDKENGDIVSIREAFTALPATLDQSSLSGEKFVYGSYRSFGGAESAPFTSQYLAQREAGIGWTTHPIASPRGRLTISPAGGLDTELKALSPDLCEAWIGRVSEPALAPGAVSGYPNIYRRHDQSCGQQSFEAVTTLAPPHRTTEDYSTLELQGASADGNAALYAAPDNLPGTGAPDLSDLEDLLGVSPHSRLQLYLHTPGKTSFVCVLPNGVAVVEPCGAGGVGVYVQHGREGRTDSAISADGSRVFWTAWTPSDNEGNELPGQIYMRSNPSQPQSALSGGKCSQPAKACTVAISQAAEEQSGTVRSQFWVASSDGSRAIFTTTTNGEGHETYLYEAEINEDAQHHLAVSDTLIASKSVGVLGASSDGRRFYFASEEDLTAGQENSFGEEAEAGQPNLYLDSEGTVRFVMTLSKEDVSGNNNYAAIARGPIYRAAQVAPDGQVAAFTSSATVGGYDNHDANNGKADAEVYLYDALADGGQGKLLCVSCNPTGSRPVGENVGEIGSVGHGSGTGTWAAAYVPRWENSLYDPRALSEDGRRLFFESRDALVAADNNEASDVYEWEAAGVGGCTPSGSTYVPASEGCLDLISSGTGGRAASFLDASPDGKDVFFTTLEGLVTQDPGLVDVYDARVDGGFAPPESEKREPCDVEGGQCQVAGPVPGGQAPTSEAVRGAGNLAPPKACPKGKVRRHGRCVKAKPKHGHKKQHKKAHHKNHHKRAHKHGRAGK